MPREQSTDTVTPSCKRRVACTAPMITGLCSSRPTVAVCPSALISSLRSLILVVAFILILPRIIGVTAGIWLTMPLSEIVTVFVALYLYRTYGKQYMLEG